MIAPDICTEYPWNVHRQPAPADLQRREEQAPRRGDRESRQRQVLYAYERTILQAFRETEDALVAYRKTGEQRRAQGERVKAERKVLELSELRYRGGVAAYLEVLDAQRSLFGAEIDEAQTIGNHLVSLVRLYKALGGGWPSAPPPAAAPAAAGAP